MLARIVLWVIFAVCAAMTVAFLSGHGANLIAGYNTATDAEKETVNERKLLRAMGGGLVATLVIFVLALLGGAAPMVLVCVSTAVIAVDSVAMVYLANTKCKK